MLRVPTARARLFSEKFGHRYVVNLQGDEPLIPRSLIRQFAEKLATLDDNSLLTCVSYADCRREIIRMSSKSFLTNGMRHFTFPRAPIPFNRDERNPHIRTRGRAPACRRTPSSGSAAIRSASLKRGKNWNSFARLRTACGSCASRPGTVRRHRYPPGRGRIQESEWKGSLGHGE